MALVAVKGKFMGANLDSKTFEGNTKVSLIIDLYQKHSPAKDKSVQVKADDIALLQTITENFEEGDEISINCTVSAYKNEAYFKLAGDIQSV
jgi:hypothetical protein